MWPNIVSFCPYLVLFCPILCILTLDFVLSLSEMERSGEGFVFTQVGLGIGI